MEIYVKNTDIKKAGYSIFAIVLAYFTATNINDFINIDSEIFSYSNSVFSVLFFVLAYLVFVSAFKNLKDIRLAIISEIVALLFSAFLFVGNNIELTGYANIYSIKSIITVVLFSPFLAAFVLLAIAKFPLLNAKSEISNFKTGKYTFPIAWALIFLCWVPIWLAMYPGVFGYDSIHQLNYYVKNAISTAHPLIHTYIVGFFVHTVGNTLGSPESGMACYSIFQMLSMSAIFAYIYTYFRKKNMPFLMSILLLLFFALVPTNAIMAISSTKDVLYAGFFALMVLLYSKIAENAECLKDIKFNIAFVIVNFMQMVFRNQGKYIFVIAIALLLVGFKKYWKRILLLFGCITVIFITYSGPITKLCNGYNPNIGFREMMSVPCVQLSRALINDVEQLSEDDIRLIKQYVPDYHYYKTVPGIADNMKATFNSKKFKDNPIEFISLWMRVGIKSPRAYIDAWARLSIGLWYPDMNYRDEEAYHPYWEYYSTDESYGLPTVSQMPVKSFAGLSDYLSKISCDNDYQKNPVISMLFSSAIPFWLLLILYAICFYYKQYKFLLPLTIPLLLWLTLMLGPVVLYRYVYPLVVSVPVLLGNTSISISKQNFS